MTEQTIDEEKQPKKQRRNWVNIGIFFSTLGMIIFVCAFGYGYFELAKVNITLARMVSDLQQATISNQNQITALHKVLSDFQQQKSQQSQQFSTLEQFMSEWRSAQKGDLDKWRIAEALYLVNLANDHLQYFHNIKLAIVLLQEADKILQNAQDQNLNDIRKSLAADLSNLQAAPQVDTASLNSRLNAMNNQVDQLPLPINPLKAQDNQLSQVTVPAGLPWWKAGLAHSLAMLSQIVIVRNNNTNVLPLVMPEEKIFLYQNLHAQMEDALWGLLHQQADVYQASLGRAAAWIKHYFVQESQVTKTMLQDIAELQKVNIASPSMNLANTLHLFDQYVGKSG